MLFLFSISPCACQFVWQDATSKPRQSLNIKKFLIYFPFTFSLLLFRGCFVFFSLPFCCLLILLFFSGLTVVHSQSGTVAGKEVPGAGGMVQLAVRLQGLSYSQWRVEEPKCSCACWGVDCSQEAGDFVVQLLLAPLVQKLAFGFSGAFGAFSSLMNVGTIWSGSVFPGSVNGLELSDTGH